MFERRIQTGEGQHLTLVDMARNVSLKCWEETEVLVRWREGGEQAVQVEETEEGPTVSSSVACDLHVPATASVTVRQVEGNLRTRGLSQLTAEQVRGNLKISGGGETVVAEVYGKLIANATESLRVVGTIYGDASLKAVAGADLQNIRGNLRVKDSDRFRASRIGGNLFVKECRGAADVDQVGGNALVKGLGGPLSLDQVAGNLVAKNLMAGATVERIGGNLMLNGDLGTGCTYRFKADGNAMLRLAEDTGAYLTLHSKGKILSSLPLADEQKEGETLSGTLGQGGAEVAVKAKGNVMLGSGQAAVGSDLGEEITRQVEESLRAIDLEAIGRQVGEEMDVAFSRLRVKLEGVDWERLGTQAERAVEHAMDRLQRDMDRMVDKAARQQTRWERKEERSARGAERATSGSRSQGVPSEHSQEAVEPEPDLEDERLSILRMVEQGQITPQEAEMLLDALR